MAYDAEWGGWRYHETCGSEMGLLLEEYQEHLASNGLLSAWKREELYSEDYYLNEDKAHIWDHAIWMITAQYLISSKEEIDYQGLFDAFEGTPEKAFYLKGNSTEEQWKQHLISTIDYFIYEE